MSFKILFVLIQFEIWLFLVGLMSVVFYFILTRKVNTRGLLFENNKNRTYSWERVQVLILTLIFVIYYLVKLKDNLGTDKLPQVPQEFLWVLGGSNLIYLWSKLYSFVKDRRAERA